MSSGGLSEQPAASDPAMRSQPPELSARYAGTCAKREHTSSTGGVGPVAKKRARPEPVHPPPLAAAQPRQTISKSPPPPPADWKWPKEGEEIEVEIEVEGRVSVCSAWKKAIVTAVLVDGWFQAQLLHDADWLDWFTWKEEGVDWRRKSSRLRPAHVAQWLAAPSGLRWRLRLDHTAKMAYLIAVLDVDAPCVKGRRAARPTAHKVHHGVAAVINHGTASVQPQKLLRLDLAKACNRLAAKATVKAIAVAVEAGVAEEESEEEEAATVQAMLESVLGGGSGGATEEGVCGPRCEEEGARYVRAAEPHPLVIEYDRSLVGRKVTLWQ